jgi:hypothetical protein
MAMNQHPRQNDDPLSKWVTHDQLEPVSPDFTGRVMDQLGLVPATKSVTVEPAISRKGWILIVLVSTAIIVLTFTGDSAFTLPSTGALFEGFRNEIISRTTGMLSGSTVTLLSFASFAVMILFVCESWYRTRRLKTAF